MLPSAPVPSLGAPTLSLKALPLNASLSPSLVPAAGLSPITPSVAVKSVAVAVSVPNVPFAPALVRVNAPPSVARPAAAASIPAFSVAVGADIPSLFDGSRTRPAASVEPRGSEAVPAALKPSPRGETLVRGAVANPPSDKKKLAAAALSWSRLSGIVWPLAGLVAAIPAAFHMDGSTWLSLSALWVGAPAVWSAVPEKWRRDHPAAAATAAVVAGAAVGAAVAVIAGWSLVTAAVVTAALGGALAYSTGSFDVLRRKPAGEKPLLGVSGGADARRLVIAPHRFGSLMLLTAVFERGLGEKDLHAAKADSYERTVYFRRSGEFVELVARDVSRRVKPGSPLDRALSEVSADATIGKAKILAEDPISGAVSIDLKEFALQDFFSIKSELEAAFDAPYALDADLSSLTRSDAYASNVEIGARQVYARRSAPEDGEPATRLADARRVTLSLRLSLAALPESGYRPRLADSRLGHFATVYEDWTDDRVGRPTRALVNRWRLEKSDETAAASKVKKPVIFWIDATVPKSYRAAVTRGVLAWNEAFARVGLLGAIEVREAPEHGFDASDARNTVIRWFMDKDAGYAIGQTRVDPLTGEIYQASLGISAVHPRSALGVDFRDLGEGFEAGDRARRAKKDAKGTHKHDHKCGHAGHLAKQAQMIMAVVESRGGMTEAEKEKFVQDYITDLTLHEVGHTLGLRHNFLAKTWKDLSELDGPAPLAASVMDYLPSNVAAPGQKQGSYWNTALGPYDFWAVEYAYKPLAPEDEARELAAIAARSEEPGHAYATDEDLVGLDPDSQTWYLGKDPLAYARGRAATAREIWNSIETRRPAPGEDHSEIYRAFVQGWRGYLDAARLAASVVGGLSYRRRAGPGPAPFSPMTGARRREALQFLDEAVFSDARFNASADLRRRLDPGRDITVDDQMPQLNWVPYDELILELRTDALSRLLDPELMQMLSESAKMADAGDEVLSPRELIETLTKMIWRDVLEPGRKRTLYVSPARRRLQEAHLNTLILLAYRHADEEVPEVSALARAHLTRLSEALAAKSERKGWDDATRDHILQSANKIDSADSRYEP